MATYMELMKAVANADAAGDEAAAQKLYNFAKGLPDAPKAASQDANPNGDPRALEAGETAPENRPPNRFGDTIAKVTAEPIEATKRAARGIIDPSQSITGNALPDWFDDSFRRRIGGMGDIALTGLNAVGTAFSAGAGLVGEVFGGDTNNETKLANDILAGAEVMIPEFGAPISAAGRAGRIGKAAEKASTPQARAAQSADDLGITPSLGMTGKTGAQAAATLEKVPFAGKAIGDDAARVGLEIEQSLSRINGAAGGVPTGAIEAGNTLQSSLNRFAASVRSRSKVLYDKVEAKIPSDTLITTPETIAAMRELAAKFGSNEELINLIGVDKWSKMADALEGGVSFAAARELRSQIGKATSKINGPLADLDGGRLKQAYTNLTRDLEAAARAAGAGPEWDRATNFYRTANKRIDRQLDQLINAKTPERAFEIFSAATKGDRATSDLNRLRAVRQSIGDEEWADVSASIVDRLGRAKPGAQGAAGDTFSSATFLTEWNKLAPEAKSLLVKPEARRELDKLLDVMEAAKKANVERNFSNTGTLGMNALVGAGAFLSAGKTGAALVAVNIGAKALTNVTFLRAMNRAATGDAKVIKAMANGSGPFAQDARTILRMMAVDAAGGNAANTKTPPAQTAIGR